MPSSLSLTGLFFSANCSLLSSDLPHRLRSTDDQREEFLLGRSEFRGYGGKSQKEVASRDVDMLVRLSRMKRLRAGWLVALIYLLCVLAPTISFALPGSQAVAPCLVDASHVSSMVHVRTEAPTRHLHNDSQGHDHSGAHSH